MPVDFCPVLCYPTTNEIGKIYIENPEYDEEVVREAIINAIIHREYMRLGAEVTVDIYDDRITIVPPSSMFSGKKIAKEVRLGVKTIHGPF